MHVKQCAGGVGAGTGMEGFSWSLNLWDYNGCGANYQ